MDDEVDTKTWVNLVDRDGSWHVNDQIYSMFYAIEEVVRTFL